MRKFFEGEKNSACQTIQYNVFNELNQLRSLVSRPNQRVVTIHREYDFSRGKHANFPRKNRVWSHVTCARVNFCIRKEKQWNVNQLTIPVLFDNVTDRTNNVPLFTLKNYNIYEEFFFNFVRTNNARKINFKFN